MDIDEILMTVEEQMQKAVDHTTSDFATINTGKASPSMVDSIVVPVASYGSSMPVRDLGAVTTPDSRLIQVQAWDQSTLADIDKAIRAANIGLNPVIDGNLLRIPIPELTRERRQELVKSAKNMAEHGRVSIRSARQDANNQIKALKGEAGVSEDDIKSAEKEVQDLTNKFVALVDKAFEAKEKDLLTV